MDAKVVDAFRSCLMPKTMLTSDPCRDRLRIEGGFDTCVYAHRLELASKNGFISNIFKEIRRRAVASTLLSL